MHEATQLLREFLEVSELFERSLGAELEVNATDLEAMEHLLMSGPLGPSELARRLGISTASTTTAIDRLVALGHVTREPNPHDRRGVLVVPQEASRDRAMRRLMPMIMGLERRARRTSTTTSRPRSRCTCGAWSTSTVITPATAAGRVPASGRSARSASAAEATSSQPAPPPAGPRHPVAPATA